MSDRRVGEPHARGLGRHVFGRAEHDARLGHLALGRRLGLAHLGDAEVQDLHEVEVGLALADLVRAALVGDAPDQLAATLARHQHDVLGLQIAVDDALAVRRSERGRHLVADGDGPQQLEAPIAREHRVQRLAHQQLHHEEDRPVLGLAEVGHLDDVGVVDQAGRARLAQEALDGLLAAAEALVQDLHGDLAADVHVLAAIHDPHAATPDDLVQAVLANSCP